MVIIILFLCPVLESHYETELGAYIQSKGSDMEKQQLEKQEKLKACESIYLPFPPAPLHPPLTPSPNTPPNILCAS